MRWALPEKFPNWIELWKEYDDTIKELAGGGISVQQKEDAKEKGNKKGGKGKEALDTSGANLLNNTSMMDGTETQGKKL